MVGLRFVQKLRRWLKVPRLGEEILAYVIPFKLFFIFLPIFINLINFQKFFNFILNFLWLKLIFLNFRFYSYFFDKLAFKIKHQKFQNLMFVENSTFFIIEKFDLVVLKMGKWNTTIVDKVSSLTNQKFPRLRIYYQNLSC